MVIDGLKELSSSAVEGSSRSESRVGVGASLKIRVGVTVGVDITEAVCVASRGGSNTSDWHEVLAAITDNNKTKIVGNCRPPLKYCG